MVITLIGGAMSVKKDSVSIEGLRERLVDPLLLTGSGIPKIRRTESSKPETWRDWVPEGTADPSYLIPRDEFVVRANALDIDVDEGDLRFWEYRGILPRAEKQWSPEVRANRSVYPRWMLGIVALLRAFQRQGKPLREIAPELRKFAHYPIKLELLLSNRDDMPEGAKDARTPLVDDLFVYFAQAATLGRVYIALDEVAKEYERATRKKVASLQIQFLDAEGNSLDDFEYGLDNASPEGNESD